MIVRAPGEDLKVLRPEATWRLARIILQSWHARICRLRDTARSASPAAAGT